MIVQIAGVASTPSGKHPDSSTRELFTDAALEGETAVGGRVPVNTSGDLLAKGHPVGATGVAQLVEITKQLEGRHPNQVDDPTVGLTHTVGGSGASCVVNVVRTGGA